MLGQCSPTNAGPRWGRVSSVNEWLKIGTHSPKKWFRHLPWIALKKDWRGPFLKEKRAEPTKYIQVYPSIGTYFTVFWAASQCFYVFCFVLMINDEAQREAGIRSVVRSQRILWYKVSTINKIIHTPKSSIYHNHALRVTQVAHRSRVDLGHIELWLAHTRDTGRISV